ncbi:hypothetical protein EJ05DRAFT_456477 [Pseudovirgaria hyperparasitica]|uniref:Peroxisome assembly protein 12 n=1 Tax=Pseudovirgaria hyperparasitica TaxID=470096 RepID=A0A6A6VXD6_9PEZI|nr:uncharacterized protein EJ05DRAFT_456477 [Pseudovirgaria hyperparasitica]KAF2754364.1 hypothetical protein EJ05DRAFT_456477 [Pseudovirgaria hyperparasitica]
MEYMTTLQSGFDGLKPSLFELLSEQQLSSLLPPSLRYLLAVSAHRHPRYLLRILNSFDELYALLSLLVERHFLRTYGGSFTENFYGLKRERVLQVRGGEVPRAQLGAASDVRATLKLRRQDVWANLAIMVGVPYIKRKLDEGYDIHAAGSNLLGPGYRADRDGLSPNSTFKQRIMYYYKWFLRRVYPSVNAAYYFALLAFNLAYLFDGAKFHSPFLWLVGTRVRRLGQADYAAIEAITNPAPQAKSTAPRAGQNNSIFNPRTMVGVVYPRVLSSFRILLPTSIFALKFLEWWHQSDFARQLSRKAAEGIELPPPVTAGLSRGLPPKPSKTSAKEVPSSSDEKPEKATTIRTPPIAASSLLPILTVPAPSNSALCPICTQPITTSTASPYGHVYCYVCIHRWVDGTHERQEAFMEGGAGEEGWEKEEGSREGRWESGRGRDAITGQRILGGTGGLRRVLA